MKLHKLYLGLAAGALGIVPVVAAEAPAAKPEAKPEVKAEAPKTDIWSKIPEVVATVDGKNITRGEFAAYLLPDGKIPPQVTAETIAKLAPDLVRKMIVNRLCEQDFKARKPKITKEEARKFLMSDYERLTPAEKKMVDQALKEQKKTIDQVVDELLARPDTLDNIAQETFAKTVIFKNTAVTDEEAKKYYDDNAAKVPEVVEATHILVLVKPKATEAEKKAALDKINRIAEEVKKNPADFEKIAAKESDCSSKKDGGKLGAFPRGRMDPEFEKAAFALKQGEISGVVRSRFGYHIIRCDAAPQRIPFEKIKGNIKQFLANAKMKSAFDAYIDGLLKQHKVEILVKAPAPAPAPAAPAPKKAAK